MEPSTATTAHVAVEMILQATTAPTNPERASIKAAVVTATGLGESAIWGFQVNGFQTSRRRKLLATYDWVVSFTVVADLAESVIKRCLEVKDSGHFLPGIGGALDLIDSLLFTGPAAWLYFHLVVTP